MSVGRLDERQWNARKWDFPVVQLSRGERPLSLEADRMPSSRNDRIAKPLRWFRGSRCRRNGSKHVVFRRLCNAFSYGSLSVLDSDMSDCAWRHAAMRTLAGTVTLIPCKGRLPLAQRISSVALAIWLGSGAAVAAPTAFGSQWSCVTPPQDSGTCISAACQATSGRKLIIDWKAKNANISGFKGKVTVVQSSQQERQIHGLLRNFVSFSYIYVRATMKEGKAKAFYYLGSDSSPEAWDFGFATCKIST